MIYTGSDEIRGIMLGSDEIQAIYAGEELIYPMGVSGFTVKPLAISFPIGGGSKNIKITSEYAWTAVVSDSWITLSTYSGDSGRTTIVATVGENETGEEISGTVVVTSTDLQHSATVDVIQQTSPIPTGYQELQYIIEPTHNYAYITTDIYMDSDMWFEFKIRPTENPGTPEKHIFSGKEFQCARVLANNRCRVRRGGTGAIYPSRKVYTWGYDTTFQLFKGNNNIIANGTNIGSFAPAEPYVDSQKAYFFSWREIDPGTTGNNLAMVGYLYYMIIGSNTTGDELYHFVPVKRLSDNEVGLYEIVNGKFYGPANNKKFTAGPAVEE